MRYALPRPEILAYPLETNVIDSVVLNSSGVAPDASGPYMLRRYMVAGTVLSKRADNTYERYTGATNVAVVDQQETLTFVGPPTGGTFALGLGSGETAQLAYPTSASALQTAIQGLPGIGSGNATVTGPVADEQGNEVYTVTVNGAEAGTETELLVADPTQLTGPGNQDIVVAELEQGSPAETSQNVAGILFDTVEFADGSELSDEPVAMLRRNVSFKAAAIVDFAAHQAAIVAGLPTCEFI
jgi:hypothetical protein